jgi:hypothetical protein
MSARAAKSTSSAGEAHAHARGLAGAGGGEEHEQRPGGVFGALAGARGSTGNGAFTGGAAFVGCEACAWHSASVPCQRHFRRRASARSHRTTAGPARRGRGRRNCVSHPFGATPEALVQAVLDDAYAAGDFHRVYFGEMVAAYADDDAAQRWLEPAGDVAYHRALIPAPYRLRWSSAPDRASVEGS